MKVEVNVLGNALTLETGDQPAAKIESAASFINAKLKNVARSSRSADTMKLALVTLLDITSDYLDLKEREVSGDEETGKEIKKLNRKLEEVLNE